MTTRTDRLRALALLFVAFVAGGAAGIAGDRAWWHPASGVSAEPPRREPNRHRSEGPEIEQIPTPLERLQLSAEETRRLHAIARRWRPKAAVELARIRPIVSDLENDMFAEMLCAISRDKQDHYFRDLRESAADSAMIAKRFRLVRTNQCPPETADPSR